MTAETDMVPIAEMESFSPSFDGNVEEWKSFNNEGWTSRLVTGKSLTISVSGKRCVGDPGNDYVANLATLTGTGCNTTVLWVLPSGAKLLIPCVINVTNNSGGETTNVGPLEFEIMSDGKPTYTPAA